MSETSMPSQTSSYSIDSLLALKLPSEPSPSPSHNGGDDSIDSGLSPSTASDSMATSSSGPLSSNNGDWIKHIFQNHQKLHILLPKERNGLSKLIETLDSDLIKKCTNG